MFCQSLKTVFNEKTIRELAGLSNVLALVSIICGAILITAAIATFVYFIRRKRRLKPYVSSKREQRIDDIHCNSVMTPKIL